MQASVLQCAGGQLFVAGTMSAHTVHQVNSSYQVSTLDSAEGPTPPMCRLWEGLALQGPPSCSPRHVALPRQYLHAQDWSTGGGPASCTLHACNLGNLMQVLTERGSFCFGRCRLALLQLRKKHQQTDPSSSSTARVASSSPSIETVDLDLFPWDLKHRWTTDLTGPSANSGVIRESHVCPPRPYRPYPVYK